MTPTTITTHTKREDALRVLGLAGFTRSAKGAFCKDGVAYWCLDEALTVAIKDISASIGMEIR